MTFVTNWLALIPWRRKRGEHWTEQARLLFPVRASANTSLWLVPAICTLLAFHIQPHSLLWVPSGTAAAFGAAFGSLFLDLEIFPRIPQKELWRLCVINCLLRVFIWSACILAILAMPGELGWRACAFGGGVVILWFIWIRDGLIWAWHGFGLLSAPPGRLLRIVTETSGRAGISFREVFVMNSPLAQAYAMPMSGRLLFTKGLLATTPDDELATICAHELAHLAEPWTARYSRYIATLSFLPWIFIGPLVHTINPGVAFLTAGLLTFAISRVFKSIGRKLESHADRAAKASEPDAGIYARALTRLYEHNLMPAVHAKGTHPSLYDRVVAAGVTPDYPKPACAAAIAWYCVLYLMIFGGLFGRVLSSALLARH